MNAKIISMAIILLMIIGSFGAVGNSNETEVEDDCGCDNTENTQNSFTDGGLGLKIPDNYAESVPINEIQPTFMLPSEFDWRDEGLPPARAQGGCGSCWAFGTIGPLECNIAIKDNEIVDLSEQELLSCTDDDCGGGFFQFYYLENTGIAMEDDFIYTGNDQLPCGEDGPYNHVYKIDDYAMIGVSPSDAQLKQAIYDYGPIGVCVYCDSWGWNWHSLWNPDGIYTGDSNEPTNHIVTLVGWNDNEGSQDPGYWILRNSWGTGFCNQGYMKFKYGICGIGDYAHYVEYSGCDLTKKTIDGDDFYWSDGDVKTGSNYARLSEGGDPGSVAYKIQVSNPNNYDVKELWVGIQFKDQSWWGNGPNFYVKKDDGSWKTLEGAMGKPESYTCTWRRFTSTSDYIDSSGYVHIKVTAQGDDDTYVRSAGIKYELRKPEPDLDCSGSISGGQVKPGARVTGSFTVKNIGESGSLLDWKVDSYPSWGSSWSFSPSSGSDLGSGSSKTVSVSFNAPSYEDSYSGTIKVINTEDSSDYDTVSVSVTTPRNRALFFNFLELLQTRFPLLFKVLYNI